MAAAATNPLRDLTRWTEIKRRLLTLEGALSPA